MAVEYVKYNKNNLKKGHDLLQDTLVSVFDFYNAHEDPRLHLEKVRWTYINRHSGHGLDGLCFLIDEDCAPEKGKKNMFTAKEYGFFVKNDVDLAFFNSVKKEIKDPESLTRLAYHELWHMIEKKNKILKQDLLYEGAAELASLICTQKNWKQIIDNSVDKYMEDELFNLDGQDENILKAHNLFYLFPTKLLSRYCDSLPDMLDEDKRVGAMIEQDMFFGMYFEENKENIELLTHLISFISKKQRQELGIDF